MSPPIRDGSGNDIGAIRLGDGSEISEVRTGAGDVLFTAGIPDSALTQDLVAWYRFEDADARDYTNDLNATFGDSTAYDGAVTGGTFQSTGGITDFENGTSSGYYDAGTDTGGEFIDCGDIANVSGPMTVMGWVKIDNDPWRGTIWSWGDSTDNVQTLYYFGTDNDKLGLNTWNADLFGISGFSGQGTFTHIATEFQDSNPSGFRLFINGVEQSLSQQKSGTDSRPINSRFVIANNLNDLLEQALYGDIDDVRVYNRSLTESEVSDIYNDTKP